jgi:hypothetical protein
MMRAAHALIALLISGAPHLPVLAQTTSAPMESPSVVRPEPGGPFTEVVGASLPRRATREREVVLLPAGTDDRPRHFRLKLAP